MTATIGIEASSIIKQRTGIGTYTYHLLVHLAGQDRTNRYRIFTNSYKDRLVDSPFTGAANFQHIHSKIPGKLLLEMWRLCRRPVIERFIGPVDLFHSTNNNPVPQGRGLRLLTVYDLFFMHHPERTGRYGGRYFHRVLPRYIREWDHIITISEAMKHELLDVFGLDPDSISVIHCGLDPFFKQSNSDSTGVSLNVPARYCLAVGTLESRKNYPNLIKAFHHFLKQVNGTYALVIAGIDGGAGAEVRQAIAKFDLNDRVVLLGYLSPAQLRWCYQKAEFFIMVSDYEGFGIPVLEAMSCGTPVIASNTTSFPEVVGKAGLLVGPRESEEISQAMLKLVTDPDLRATLVGRGLTHCQRFSWEKTARDTLALYTRLLAQ